MCLHRILTGVLCFLSSWPAWAQRFDKSILLEGRKREFIVVQPSGNAPKNGFPVVFMFHGTSGDGEKMYQTSGWKELGETEKFISVYPSSLAYCINDPQEGMGVTTKWNNGDLQTAACPGQILRDDLSFIRSIVDTLKKGFSIDSRRIYACGFSNGAAMTAKLAVAMSDLFAATVSASGPLFDLDSGQVNPKIPCWFTVGTRDDRFLDAIGQGLSSFPYNDSALLILQNPIDNFLGSMGLKQTYSSKDSIAKLTFYQFNRDLNNMLTENKFVFLLAKDMFHVFPNGTNYPVFESAPLYWNQFFKNIIKPLSTPVNYQKTVKRSWTLVSNINQTHLWIKSEFPLIREKINIVDYLGQVYQTLELNGMDQRVDISGLAPGLYFIQGKLGSGKFVRL